MPSAKEMRDELRMLRKESLKPVSRMKMGDVSAELERMRGKRESTPPVASMPMDKAPKAMAAKMADVKEMKAAEFPTKPVDMKEKMAALRAKKGSGKVEEPKKEPMSKKSKLEKLMAMLEEDSE
jgi:hypothetical protein